MHKSSTSHKNLSHISIIGYNMTLKIINIGNWNAELDYGGAAQDRDAVAPIMMMIVITVKLKVYLVFSY